MENGYSLMGGKGEIIRPVVATVDLDNIRHNVEFLRGLLEPECLFMAVVKADAYGHGDVEVSRAALAGGAERLGVALVEEGIRLRRAGFDCPVHLLFEPTPGAAAAVLDSGLISTVYTARMARALSEEAVPGGVKSPVHIKVDTGMHRMGIYPEEVAEFAGFLGRLPGIEVEGIYTHFAVADRVGHPFTEGQMDRFEQAAAVAEEVLGKPLMKHAANSAAVLASPRSHYDMVRVGIAMLGLPPSGEFAGEARLRPALSLTGEVALAKRVPAGEGISYGLRYAPERDTYIALLPLGYADGFSRLLSGKAEVLIGGVRRPVVGAVCMDHIMVDMGQEPVEPGTPFTVIGVEGDEEITTDEVAKRLGTINYEVTCMISPRVPRVYTRKEEGGI
ncbi:MAG: alanine racemase [Actinomycetia bacterium]|nr:alanine racemase [Actinomycetes bacterium]